MRPGAEGCKMGERKLRVILTTLNAKYPHVSLALRCLRPQCEEAADEVRLLEFTINQPLLEMLGRLYDEAPDVVAFGCYIWNWEMTRALVRLVRKALPAARIVCGGPEVSYDAAALLSEERAIDYVVCGEGELALGALLKRLRRGESPAGISGVAYRAADGAAAGGAPAEIAPLETLAFAYREAEMEALANRIVYYESARGCPFSCRYCLSGGTGGVRFLPVARVLAELRFFMRHGVRQVKFVDRTFNARKEHALAIWNFVAEADCRTNFHFEIAADLLDEDMLLALAKMPRGRAQLEIGVQTTNPETLQKISRKNRWDAIARNVRALRAMGTMHLHLDLIAGLPGETYASFGRSFDDVYGLQPDMLQIGFLKLLKGSGLRADARLYGYVATDGAPYQVLASDALPYGEMRRLQLFEDVFELYYNAGRFRNATAYLVRVEDSAFRFYEHLTAYWQRAGLHLAAHGVPALYEHLLAFCREAYPAHCEAVGALLKLDALLTDGGKTRPPCLPWSAAAQDDDAAFWRESAAAFLPGFVFTNWRDVHRRYRIERFCIDVAAWLDCGALRLRETTALFDYTGGRIAWKLLAAKSGEA